MLRFILIAAVLAVPSFALADDGTSVVIKSLIDYAVQLLFAILAGLGTAALAFVIRKLNIDANSTLAARMHDGLERALAYAYQQSGALIDQHGLGSVEVKNSVLRIAAQYANSYLPGTLAKLKVTPQALEDLLIANIGKGAVPIALPPAAPIA